MMDKEDMPKSDMLSVARIMGPHGLKGLMKLKYFGDDISVLEQDNVAFDKDGKPVTLTLKNKVKDHWLVEVDGIHDRTMAENRGKFDIFIHRDSLPDLESNDDDYYHDDLIGVITKDAQTHKAIGTIIAIHNFGAGDLLEIKPENTPSFMVPFANNFAGDLVKDDKENYIPLSDYQAFIE